MSALSHALAELTRRRFQLNEITPAEYAAMQYPKWLPMMRFTVHQYEVRGFGHLMTMDTRAMGGLMQLSTIVFTPDSGLGVPFLLIDTMTMRKKALAYVEYYDCTADGAAMTTARSQPTDYASLPDYAEKPAWYVERRTPYSLIKGGNGADVSRLEAMVCDCVLRYLDEADKAKADPRNLPGLKRFQQEMLEKGNPSSGTLNKVLGADGAKQFFEQVIMPCRIDERS